MPKDKSLTELMATYHEVKSKFEEINQNAIRDRRSDYPMLPQDELSESLNSNISRWKKRKLLHTQIGYLRINLFHEYYEQIVNLQQKNNFHKAAELMNKYAETIAIPFVSTRKQPALIKKLREIFRVGELFEPADTIRVWRGTYQSWLQHGASPQSQKKRKERSADFQKLLTAFLTLYTYSFSVNNFPPLGQRRTDR